MIWGMSRLIRGCLRMCGFLMMDWCWSRKFHDAGGISICGGMEGAIWRGRARVGDHYRNFDGVHLGHSEILGRLVERSCRASLRSTVVTFDPHPLRLLRPNDAPALLLTLEQRLAEIGRRPVEAALVLRFDAALASLSAREFVEDIVVHTLRTKAILVGENFRFGHRGAGDVSMLREFGSEFGFAVECIDPVVCRGEVVSSSAIRRAVAKGR